MSCISCFIIYLNKYENKVDLFIKLCVPNIINFYRKINFDAKSLPFCLRDHFNNFHINGLNSLMTFNFNFCDYHSFASLSELVHLRHTDLFQHKILIYLFFKTAQDVFRRAFHKSALPNSTTSKT